MLDRAIELFGTPSTTVAIPHASYIEWYGPPPPRSEARRLLGLPRTSPVFLYCGLVRPYKGVERLIETFRECAPAGAVLVIAGQPRSSYGDTIASVASSDPRIRLHQSFIPDRLAPSYFGAADVVVLPYVEVTTSGTVVLAHSMGRPVIAPSAGCIPDIVPPGTGILYDPRRHGGLAEALLQALELDRAQTSSRCLDHARAWNWGDVARETKAVYESATRAARHREERDVKAIATAGEPNGKPHCGFPSLDNLDRCFSRMSSVVAQNTLEMPGAGARFSCKVQAGGSSPLSWIVSVAPESICIAHSDGPADCTISA